MAAARRQSIRQQLAQPWLRAVLYVTLIPLFPEYIAPVFTMLSLAAAAREAAAARRRITLGASGKALLLLILYLTITIPFAAMPLQSLESTLLWWMIFCACLSVTTVLTDRNRMETALFLLTVTAGTVGLVGCVQYFLRQIGLNTPLQLWEPVDEFVYRLIPLDIDIRLTGVRVCSTFTNPNILGQYLVLVTPFAVYYTFSAAKGRRRTLGQFSLLAMIGSAAFTFSRGAYLALLIGGAILVLVNMRSLLSVALSALAAVLLVPKAVWERLMTVGSMDASTLERFSIWRIALNLITRRPLLGYGSGVQYFWSIMRANHIHAPHAHNLALQTMLEGGIVGLFILLFLGFRVIQTAFALTARKECRRAGGTVLAFFAGYAALTMVEYGFTFPKLMGVFAMTLALIDGFSNLLLDRAPSPLAETFTLSEWRTARRKAEK